MRALRDLERELEQQGYLTRGDDGLRLTPRRVRRLGQTALRRVFAQLAANGQGDHDDHRTGCRRRADRTEPGLGLRRRAAHRCTPDGGNALRRRADDAPEPRRKSSRAVLGRAPRRHASSQPPTTRMLLDVEDFEVTETERRTSAAVALCVDLSFSMVQDGRWGPMKQTALALNHLIETRFRQDALQVVGFHRTARRLTPVQLAQAEPEWIQGTNLQHALLLAARHLRRHPDAEPVVLVVTDGEPTAHLIGGAHHLLLADHPGDGPGHHRPGRRAGPLWRHHQHLHARRGPGLRSIRRRLGSASGWPSLHPDIGRLGEYVVADYLRARRGRRA